MPSEQQFPCPFCGEKISKSAKLCRFCKSNVSYDLYIFQIPEDTKRGEIAKKIVEIDKSKFFRTFGEARKALEKKDKPFLENLRLEDAERFTHIFEENDIPFDQTIHNHNINPPFWERKKNSIMVSLCVICAGLIIYFYKHPAPSMLPKVTVQETIPEDAVSERAIKKVDTEDTNTPPMSKEAHANIESLLISTATVFAGDSEGSAFFVSREGHLISNQHVTKSYTEVQVQTYDGRKFKGTVLKSDPYYDLCLIKIESQDYPPLKLGDSTKLHPGDTVWTIGAPHGLSFSVTKGIASYVGRNVGGKAYVQADVAINPGNSGGPMIDDEGYVIGINNFIIKETQGLNFAIPANYLYMGTAPILENVVSTQPDNGTMVTWRSWEKGAPANSKNSDHNSPAPETPSPGSSEMDRLSQQLKSAEDEMRAKQKRKDTEIADIQDKIDDFSKGFNNAQTVSDQELIVETVRKLKIQRIDLEIAKIDYFLSYNKAATELMIRAKQITGSDPAAARHYDQELAKLAQNKKDAQEQRNQKASERNSLANAS